MTKKLKMVCDECGSTDVLKDAYASWDETTQTWVVHSVFDSGACCQDCDGECRIDEEEIK